MTNTVTDWSPTCEVVPLADNALHIWRALASEHEPALARYTRYLSIEELQRAGRLRRPEVKNRFIISRGLLRALLGNYLGCRPESIHIASSLQGKPHLPAPFSASQLQFNLSHSRDAMLFAVRFGEPVGIDTEYMRDNLDFTSLAKQFLSADEYRDISSLTGLEQKIAFYTRWTRKEAYLKATGKGLAGLMDASALENGLSPAGERWSVTDLKIPESSYAGAVAFAGGTAQIEALLLTPDNPGL